MSVKPSPGVSMASSALASSCGATLRIADRRPVTAVRSVSSCCCMSRCRSTIMSTSRRQTFFMNAHGAVELGVARQLAARLADAIRHVGRRHRRGCRASATMPLGSSMPRDSSDFFSSALSRCSRRDLAFQRRALVRHRLAGPAGRGPAALRDLAGALNRAARSRRRCGGRCSGRRRRTGAAERLALRRRLRAGAIRQRSGEPATEPDSAATRPASRTLTAATRHLIAAGRATHIGLAIGSGEAQT